MYSGLHGWARLVAVSSLWSVRQACLASAIRSMATEAPFGGPLFAGERHMSAPPADDIIPAPPSASPADRHAGRDAVQFPFGEEQYAPDEPAYEFNEKRLRARYRAIPTPFGRRRLDSDFRHQYRAAPFLEYCRILDVNPHLLTEETLKKAYKAKAIEWHPDRHSGAHAKTAELRFKQAQEAYLGLQQWLQRGRRSAAAGASTAPSSGTPTSGSPSSARSRTS